ncbi:AMP-dependent synthetase/ligase [Endozoicomonadaceae bacterium StTr2]
MTDSKFHIVRLMCERISNNAHREAMRWKQGNEWTSLDWETVGSKVGAIARSLLKFGLQPQDKTAIYSRNMPEWTLADLGTLFTRGVTVPVYPTSTTAQTEYIIQDAGVRLLFVGEQAEYDRALPLLERCPTLERLVVLDSSTDLKGCEQACYLENFVEEGDSAEMEALLQTRIEQARMDDLLTLIYTSGTTGTPKGVMLDYTNIGAAMESHNEVIDLGETDVSLCFLPLSHIFERAWSFYVLYRGAVNVYTRNPANVGDVIGEVKPTVMCAVPRFYEKVHAAIMEKVQQAPKFKQLMFNTALKIGNKNFSYIRTGKSVPWWVKQLHKTAEKAVLGKLRLALGGKIRYMPCGGARLMDEVNLFFHAIGIHVKYGYGLTETTATVTCCQSQQFKMGSVGTAMPGVEVKIGTDNEILVKGPTVMRGYFNKSEETAEVLRDGWLHTGDAGEIDEQGRLQMTERLKDLMKTSGGKYIAPQVIESLLGQDRFIEQIAIVADARKYVSALIVPTFESLEHYAKSINLKYESKMDLVRHSKVNEMFEERIQQLQQQLARFEQVKKFTLLPREFSIDKGELTPTLKLRRKNITARYKAEIEAMYTKHVKKAQD